MINTSKTTMLFSTDSAFGIVDIRSIGFFNIKHATLQYNLSKQLPQYNKLVAKHDEQLKSKHAAKHGKHVKQPRQSADPYPWLESLDPRRNMTDEEILRKYMEQVYNVDHCLNFLFAPSETFIRRSHFIEKYSLNIFHMNIQCKCSL